MIAQYIINQNKSLITALFKSDRSDVDIIALILCEKHFRGKINRIVEYCVIPILFIIDKSRLSTLSVGVGQIQVRHWATFRENKSPISIKAYISYFSNFENYDVLKQLIHSNFKDSYSDSKLLAFHTGETRKYHFKLFQQLRNELENFPKKQQPRGR